MLKENATPKRGYNKKQTDEQRFWKLVKKTEDCWLWIGYKLKKGYGTFRINSPRKKVLAHRFSYFLKHGNIFIKSMNLFTGKN
jgi:hypothetical protein